MRFPAGSVVICWEIAQLTIHPRSDDDDNSCIAVYSPARHGHVDRSTSLLDAILGGRSRSSVPVRGGLGTVSTRTCSGTEPICWQEIARVGCHSAFSLCQLTCCQPHAFPFRREHPPADAGRVRWELGSVRGRFRSRRGPLKRGPHPRQPIVVWDWSRNPTWTLQPGLGVLALQCFIPNPTTSPSFMGAAWEAKAEKTRDLGPFVCPSSATLHQGTFSES